MVKNEGDKKIEVGENSLKKKREVGGKKYKGIRQRKWGNWVAEVSDPFTKRRLWLGTFKTLEEAHKVYAAKEQEFRERQQVQECMDRTQPGWGARAAASSQIGEQSAEGHSFPILIDHNGFMHGEQANLDDSLKID